MTDDQNNLEETEGVEPMPSEELAEEAGEAVAPLPDEELGDDAVVELDETGEPAPDPDVEAAADEEPEAEADEAPKAKKPAAKKPAAKKPAATKRGHTARSAGSAKKAPAKKEEEPAAPARIVHAKAKYVRTSARKARLVCDQIRGKDVGEAYAILAHTPRAVAEDWEKLLKSAVANAENNHELVGDELRIHAAFADEGPTLKRFRPRAMGRATKIRKRTSHLTIELISKD